MLSNFTEDALYKKMIEEIQDYAIILIDENGYIQNWNRGAQKIKQYTEDEILGKHFSTFYLQHDREEALPQKLLQEARSSGRAIHEGWRVRKDGSKFWGSVVITAIHGSDSDIVGFCKVTRDLTDRKIQEDQLLMSEERYHNMIAEVQDYAIILLDVEGVVQNWNVGAEKIKGYQSHEIVGKKIELFYPSEDRLQGLPYRLLNLAKENGKAAHEGWRIRKDGTKFWGSITITALHNKANDVIGFSKVTRDLTEKKIAEDRLALYTSELEKQNKELEQFAYIASHDLQEPIRKIQIFTELIKHNSGDKEFLEKHLDKLNSSAKRMKALVQSVLNYSRLDNIGQNNEEVVDLNIVLNDAKQDLELLIQEKNAVIKSDALPSVKGNPVQLGQLWFNLISNSLKFCKEEPIITITSSLIPRAMIADAPQTLTAEHYHQIDFQDNGIGFEEQYKERIFSLFQRLHSKQDYEGTGIGLALCKKIVERCNGHIKADSPGNEGAVFTVYLPAIV